MQYSSKTYRIIFFTLISCTPCIEILAETFKLASWNILSEIPYQYAFEKENPRLTLMNVKERVKLHKKYLRDLKNNGVDIICLQEVNLNPQSSDGTQLIEYLEEELGYTVFYLDEQAVKTAFSNMLNPIKTQLRRTPSAVIPNDATIIKVLTKKALAQSTCIAYNPKKVELTGATASRAFLLWDITQLTIHSTQIQPPQIKNIASAAFQLKANKKIPELLITSLHLPFTTAENPQTDNASTFLPMLQLGYTLKQRTNKNGFSIICGDFNWPAQTYRYPHQTTKGKATVDVQGKTYYDILTADHPFENMIPTKWRNAADNHFWPTMLTGAGVLATFDYIFYTPIPHNQQGKPLGSYRLTCTDFWQKPDIRSNYWAKLIKHSYITTESGYKLPILENEVAFTNFPSDHAILVAEFEIVDTAQWVSEASLLKLGQALTSLVK